MLTGSERIRGLSGSKTVELHTRRGGDISGGIRVVAGGSRLHGPPLLLGNWREP